MKTEILSPSYGGNIVLAFLNITNFDKGGNGS